MYVEFLHMNCDEKRLAISIDLRIFPSFNSWFQSYFDSIVRFCYSVILFFMGSNLRVKV